jgi:hypothetical protein
MTWLKRVVEGGPPWETRAARDLGQEKSWVRSGGDPVTTSGLGSGDPEGIIISWCGNRISLHFVQEVLRASGSRHCGAIVTGECIKYPE